MTISNGVSLLRGNYFLKNYVVVNSDYDSSQNLVCDVCLAQEKQRLKEQELHLESLLAKAPLVFEDRISCADIPNLRLEKEVIY